MTWRRSPVPLAGAVEALAGRLEPLTPLTAVQRAWPAAAGEVMAGRARPVAERAGVVTVECEGAVWAQELDLLGPEVVARLNTALGGERVTGLRCVTKGSRRRR